MSRAGARACPKCKSDSRVLKTRDSGGKTIRRRLCTNPKCGHAFPTVEEYGELGLIRLSQT